MTKVGLILGGGGIAGFAWHTTTLSVLQQLTDWDPRSADLIVGTSAGANIGALLRGGVPVTESLDELLTVPTNPRSMERLRALSGREQRNRIPRLLPASIPMVVREAARGPFARPARVFSGLMPPGRIRTDAIGDRVLELHPDAWPEERFWVVAVRMSDSRRVVFGRDRTDIDVASATEASSAIPGFFQPVWIDQHHHVDGGVHSPTNADLVADEDLDLVVIVAPMSVQPTPRALLTPLGGLRFWWRTQVHKEADELRKLGHEVLVIEPSVEEVRAMGPSMMDPTRVVNVVLQSTSAARIALTEDRLGNELDLLRSAAGSNA